MTIATEPISELLKEGTAKAHLKAENSEGAISLVRGELDLSEYIRFLMMISMIYGTLESALDAHSSNSVLEPIYNPTVLAREHRISLDITHFLSNPNWKEDSMYGALVVDPPGPLRAYVNRLLECAATAPHLLLAHAYVRYLGDLSGGQIIKRRIQKAYNLRADGGLGTQFYEFDNFNGDSSTHADLKQIKEWFRTGMNTGVPVDDVETKLALVEEAQLAFLLNQNLFKILRFPKGTINDIGPSLTSPTNLDPVVFEKGGTDMKTETHGRMVEVFHGGSSMEESVSSVQSFAALILVAFLTHLILVQCGLTGESGGMKLQELLAWLGGVMDSKEA